MGKFALLLGFFVIASLDLLAQRGKCNPLDHENIYLDGKEAAVIVTTTMLIVCVLIYKCFHPETICRQFMSKSFGKEKTKPDAEPSASEGTGDTETPKDAQ